MEVDLSRFSIMVSITLERYMKRVKKINIYKFPL